MISVKKVYVFPVYYSLHVSVTNANCLTMSYGGPRNSSLQRARCTPVIKLSFEHYTVDSTVWLDSTPIFRKNTLGVVRNLLPFFLIHQSHERRLVDEEGY
ncbi:hypothetical protein TNCV_4047651 [Trichonephila clavipes]|nr:hypothetical protein TNCV_4047651 [Trichonephila clavipes]